MTQEMSVQEKPDYDYPLLVFGGIAVYLVAAWAGIFWAGSCLASWIRTFF